MIYPKITVYKMGKFTQNMYGKKWVKSAEVYIITTKKLYFKIQSIIFIEKNAFFYPFLVKPEMGKY
jgi:hypothetical protein